MNKKLFRIISITMLVVLSLALVTFTAGAVARVNLAKRYPAPGQLVDVGGYKMHIHCMGEGSPTVILDAGLGDFSVIWEKVLPAAAQTTRVCSYDRAGYGWSGPSPIPRTASSMAEELHTLLVNAGIEGPYVLVGHSLGGLLVRVYTHNYPDEVAGIVLVDSTHEEQYIRLSAAVPKYSELLKDNNKQMAGQYRLFRMLSSTGIMALMPQSIPNPGFSEAVFGQYKAVWATTSFFSTILAEGEALDEILAEVRSLHITSFGTLPLVVISAGVSGENPNFSDLENQKIALVQQNLQSDLAALSTGSKQIVAEHSGHYIQSDQPGLVIDAILDLVQLIRSNSH